MRIIPVKINEGDVVHRSIEEYIRRNSLKGGIITGIGGLMEAVIGFYSPESKTYLEKRIKSSGSVIEVASLQGNYLVKRNGEVSIHIHVVAGFENTTVAGHLIHGTAKPMLEVFLIEIGEVVGETFIHRAR
ncbi:PCC domain-containing protein [Desulfurococcus amylolyticus]|uniref:PCC domain-containing protein n=1 Tax=Desulfurococcus TaxID=2273 RepID=UPI0005B22181|nr:DUF296 domain-containing protein [Desulfurococcus amylolyticus]